MMLRGYHDSDGYGALRPTVSRSLDNISLLVAVCGCGSRDLIISGCAPRTELVLLRLQAR